VKIYAGSFFRSSMTIANKAKFRYPRKKPTYTVCGGIMVGFVVSVVH